MRLIVGLGNPGKEYENTRHNFGFMAVLDFWEKHQDVFSKWKEKNQALIAEGKLEGEKLVLAMPQTFMNNSGEAVAALAPHFLTLRKGKTKRGYENLWIIHDDLDLPLGTTRLAFGASSAGHKGVESVIKALKTKDFVRFRLGIKPARGLGRKTPFFSPLKGEMKRGFVLEKFSKSEMVKVREVLEKTSNALESALDIGIGRVMTSYNKLT